MSTRPGPGNLFAIYARHDNACRLVAGLSATTPVLAEVWQQVNLALADVPALGATVTRLAAELTDTRLDRASLLAAIRATLQADGDGEPDPLAYLREELEDRETRRGHEL